jgi:hypothetical protein
MTTSRANKVRINAVMFLSFHGSFSAAIQFTVIAQLHPRRADRTARNLIPSSDALRPSPRLTAFVVYRSSATHLRAVTIGRNLPGSGDDFPKRLVVTSEGGGSVKRGPRGRHRTVGQMNRSSRIGGSPARSTSRRPTGIRTACALYFTAIRCSDRLP